MNKIAALLAFLVAIAVAGLAWWHSTNTQHTVRDQMVPELSRVSAQLASIRKELNALNRENAKMRRDIGAVEQSLRATLHNDYRKAAESAQDRSLQTSEEVESAVADGVNEKLEKAKEQLGTACLPGSEGSDVPCAELEEAVRVTEGAAKTALAAKSPEQFKAAQEAVKSAGTVVRDQLAVLLDQLSAKRSEFEALCKNSAGSEQCKALEQSIKKIEAAIRAMRSLDSAKSTLDAVLAAGIACGAAYAAYASGAYEAAAAAGPSCLKAILELLKLLGSGDGEGEGKGPVPEAPIGGVQTPDTPEGPEGERNSGALSVVCGTAGECNTALRLAANTIEVVTEGRVVANLKVDNQLRSKIRQAQSDGKKFQFTRTKGSGWRIAFGTPDAQNVIPASAGQTEVLTFDSNGDLEK